ncbi:uncharacterized protein LOC143230071 isoform X2 [Tachypleus tridentatus]|uniref:uncharacterized protein LOC143230071 isoform X2 n=1 Tax=Tachypleus tridentatus TaxID=6853 RepID=UPI003FCF56F4
MHSAIFRYFYNPEILDRVPTFFLILGAVQGGIIFIGLLLYQEPRSETPKTYGQTFIDDDTFLATSGSTSAVVHSLFRVIVGRIQDKISYKLTSLILMGLKTILLFTLVATSYGGKVMFIIWICGLFATFSVEFVCIPATISEVFGKKHTAMIYGMAYFVAGGTLLFWPLMLKLIIPHFGWFGTFSLMGSMTFIGFLVVMVFPERYLTQPTKTTVSNEEEITFDEAVLDAEQDI